jgi:hypothetical protein
MKGLIYSTLLVFLLLNSSLSAQTGIRLGFKGGYNIGTQYGIKPANIPYDVSSSARNGLVGGFILYFPITESFGVQQEFLYVTKGSKQQVTMTQPPVSTTSEYKIDYFELPMVFRYTFAKIGNVGIYGSSGFALSTLLKGKYSVDGAVNIGGVKVPFSESGNTDGLDKFDYSFIYGLGMNFKLLNKDFFLEYRMTVGWNTLAMPNVKGAATVPLRNQDYILTLGFYL